MIDIVKYESYLKENECEPNTIKNYRITLELLERYLGENNYTELTKEAVIDFKQHLIKKGYAVSTINNRITILNIYFNYLGKQSELRLKRVKQQQNTHREYLEENDYKRLLKHCHKKELELFIKTFANTGTRIAEIKQIRYCDLVGKKIQIKNKGKYRNMTIPAWLKKELTKYFAGYEQEQLLFTKSENYYRKLLKQLAGKARVKKSRVYPHSFRHYFAKKFLKDGGQLTTLQQLLGHSSIQTTAIYTQLNEDELMAEYAKIKNK